MRKSFALCLFGFSLASVASETKFDVKDDIYAFPQYSVTFSTSYASEDEAYSKLAKSYGGAAAPAPSDISTRPNELPIPDEDGYDYEYMIANGRPYLCSTPRVERTTNESAGQQQSNSKDELDLVAVANRGWQLLRDMEGKQCLYYSTGWWSYAFCYNSHIKQFHGVNFGANGARIWPPQEDPTTPSYILGKYDVKSSKKSSKAQEEKHTPTEALQIQAETTYLVQKLEGGTPCDLTGQPRKIEIQYHCNPQSTDRIGWIKETTTCAYLMVIYTPRLCNDIAFQPPKESKTHPIICQEISTTEAAAELTQSNSEDKPQASEKFEEQALRVGKIVIGGMNLVGPDSKKIEKGSIVMTADEKAKVVIMQKDGQIQGLSRTELKKLDLKPEEIESFQKELQKIAGSKDWKIERVGDANGQIQLRGVVASDSAAGNEKDDKFKGKSADEEPDQKGSQEEYKDEL